MGRHSIPGSDDPADDAPDDSAPGDDWGSWDAAERHGDRLDDLEDLDSDDWDDSAVDPARYLRYRAGEGADYPFAPGRYQGPALPAEESPETGSHRTAVEWTGGHRFDGGRRGVSVGVVAALTTVIALVSVVIVWRFFGSSLAHRSETAAGRCVAGELAVPVVADPSIVDHLEEFATRFNKSAKPVGDSCVSVRVRPADTDAVIAGFSSEWPTQLGERPALWLPGSSASTARLTAAIGQEAVIDARSLATSPVMLAVRPELAAALGDRGWPDLSQLQGDADALAALGFRDWGALRLAMPTGDNGDAVFLSGVAVAADGIDALRTMLTDRPHLDDDSLGEAMNALVRAEDPAAAPVHAVVTTEQQIFRWGQSLPDPAGTLTGWLPSGPVPLADYPAVLLNGSWLSQDQQAAASEFARFIHKADQLAELARAGFRIEGIDPPSSDVTSFPAVNEAMPTDDRSTDTAVAETLGLRSGNVAVTIMLDQSMTTLEGTRTRLAWVIAALQNGIATLPGQSAVGLWTFDGIEGRTVVSTGPLDDDADDQPRSTTLSTALDDLSSVSGGAVSFTTLRMVYDQAVADYRDGQQNSVLVITAGPHTDRSLDGPGLQDFIRRTHDSRHPVAVHIIDFGDDDDQSTWQAVAELSGGTYRHLATANSPALTSAVDAALS